MVLPSFGEPSNWIEVRDPAERADVAAFARRAAAMDEAAAVRLICRGGGVRLWARTPFGALITRLVVGTGSAEDQVVLAHALAQAADSRPQTQGEAQGEAQDERIDLGYLMPSAWQGMLPPPTGFTAVEMVAAQEILDLAARGRDVAAAESGPAGIAPSLLEQKVLHVTTETTGPGDRDISNDPDDTDDPDDPDGPAQPSATGVPMRMLFALTGAGFIPARGGKAPAGERVRISTRGPWVRIDARFGSTYWRPDPIALSVAGQDAPGLL